MSKTAKIEYVSEAEKVSMSDDWFEIANENHFWMQWRFKVFEKYIQKYIDKDEKILEIGCGNGVFRDQLESLGYVVDGCDLNLKALEMAKDGKGRLMVYNIFDKNEKMIHAYNSIFLMDVVEHLEDDVHFMKVITDHLTDEGKVVINVPANMWLFSKYDTEAGHYRRYVKSNMKKLLQEVGMEIIDMRYWGGSLVPIALLRKAMLSMNDQKIIEKGFTPPSNFIHQLLKSLNNAEISLPSIPIGTSLMVIAKKSAPLNK